MKKTASLIFFFAFAITSLYANAQNPTASPTQNSNVEPADEDSVVRITTNLVQIDAVVTDKKGRIVKDLGPDDFEITANERPQKITNFSLVTIEAPASGAPVTSTYKADKSRPPLPPASIRPGDIKRTIAVVVDDLNLSFVDMHFVREALKKFVEKDLQPGDLVAIIRTGSNLGTLQQFTSDRQRLYSAIQQLKYNFAARRISAVESLGSAQIKPEAPSDGEIGIKKGEDYEQFQGDNLAIASLTAVKYVTEGMRRLPGRKSVMLLSPGFSLTGRDDSDYRSRVRDSVHRVVDSASRAGVAIYTMDPRGLQTVGLEARDDVNRDPNALTMYSRTTMSGEEIQGKLQGRMNSLRDTQDGLKFLAEEGGGFATINSNDLSGGIRKALDDQSSYYLIGYQPDAGTFEAGRGKYNQLKVTVKRPGLEVRYRSGFLGIKDEDVRPLARTPQQEVLGALVSPFASADVSLRFTPIFINDEKSGSYVKSLVHISAKDLTFTIRPDGNREAVLDVAAVIFSDNGESLSGKSETHTITLTEDHYSAALRSGFVYALNVPVKKSGGYQLRVAVRDSKSERIGSATQFVTIPDIKKGNFALSGIGLNSNDGLPAQEEAGKSGVAEEAGRGGSDLLTQAAMRRFRNGQILQYGTVVYNSKPDKKTRQPKISTHIELYRDGELIFSGNEQPYDAGKQADLSRLVLEGALQLGGLQEGEYVLQVVARDLASPSKSRVAKNWIDFEIVKGTSASKN